MKIYSERRSCAMKRLPSSVILICSISLLGCAGNRPVQYVDKLPISDRISVGEVAVYAGLETNEKADLNDPHFSELAAAYRKELTENLKSVDFSVGIPDCADCLVLKTKLNERLPRLGGALGILGMGKVRASIEVYEKDKLVYSFTSEALTDLFFGSVAQVRRAVAPEIAKQLQKKIHPKGGRK